MVAAEGGEALTLLLEVQRHDTALERLNFRLRELEERRSLDELGARRAKLEDRIGELAARQSELARRQQEIERHVEAHAERIGVIEARMREGAGFREVEAMSEETASLSRQRRALEDDELEVMERLEELEHELGPLEEERARILEEESSLAERLAAAEAEIGIEAAAVASERAELASRLPAALTATYERLRERLGGTGAAKLVDGTCSGCHLRLPSSERERIAHAAPGEVVFCEQCGRILVP